MLVNTGGSFKVTDLEDTAERIDNAFDKAISDHDKKMKKFAKDKEKEDECKYFNKIMGNISYSIKVRIYFCCISFLLLLKLLYILYCILYIIRLYICHCYSVRRNPQTNGANYGKFRGH